MAIVSNNVFCSVLGVMFVFSLCNFISIILYIFPYYNNHNSLFGTIKLKSCQSPSLITI